MALKAGYYGLKRSLLNKVKALPGIKSIGSGLSLNSTTGELEATGTTIPIEANPEGAATGNLIKLGLGDDIYAVPDAAKTYQTDDVTESSIVDADYIPFLDSSAASGSGAPRKSTWSNFKSKLKSVFDALYFTWTANGRLGAKNLLNNTASTDTQSSITLTVNADKSVTISTTGTPTGGINLAVGRFLCKANVKYILNGAPNLETANIKLRVGKLDSESAAGPGTADDNASYDGGYTPTRTGILQYEADQWVEVSVNIQANTAVTSGTTFYPMIRDGEDPDPSYVPYAMTNRELTEKVSVKDVSIAIHADAIDKITLHNDAYLEEVSGVVNGFIRFQVNETLTNQQSILSLGKGAIKTSMLPAMDLQTKDMLPVFLNTNGTITLFSGAVPITDHSIVIFVNYITS